MSAPASQRTKVKRAAERASYEIERIHSILDEGLVAHVGLVQDGSPVVIPMGYARKGDQLLLHGSISSRLMKVRWCRLLSCAGGVNAHGLLLKSCPVEVVTAISRQLSRVQKFALLSPCWTG